MRGAASSPGTAFEWTGERVKSRLRQGHGNEIRVWRLRSRIYNDTAPDEGAGRGSSDDDA